MDEQRIDVERDGHQASPQWSESRADLRPRDRASVQDLISYRRSVQSSNTMQTFPVWPPAASS